jgi:hypothetical protein
LITHFGFADATRLVWWDCHSDTVYGQYSPVPAETDSEGKRVAGPMATKSQSFEIDNYLAKLQL